MSLYHSESEEEEKNIWADFLFSAWNSNSRFCFDRIKIWTSNSNSNSNSDFTYQQPLRGWKMLLLKETLSWTRKWGREEKPNWEKSDQTKRRKRTGQRHKRKIGTTRFSSCKFTDRQTKRTLDIERKKELNIEIN